MRHDSPRIHPSVSRHPQLDLERDGVDTLRMRALQALHEGRFDLAGDLLAQEDADRAALIENLRIYQTELELQNEELVRTQLEKQGALERFLSFFNSLPIAELVIDRQGVVREANIEAHRLFGLRDTQFHQYFFARLVHPTEREHLVQTWQGMRAHDVIELTGIRFRDRSEDGFIGDLRIAALPQTSDHQAQFVCAVIDRTERLAAAAALRASQVELAHLANHDPLTALPNRELFQARLEQSLRHAGRDGSRLALLLLDLDHFKQVNDSLGHPSGDILLQKVAERLLSHLRSTDTLARLGGDEFGIIVENVSTPHQASNLADTLLAAFASPLEANRRELFVSASIGISLYPNDGTNLETLLRHAEIAMYRAKEEGRNGYSFFEHTMSERAIERLRLEQELRGALTRQEFLLHFQAQIDLNTNHLVGVEALCRWRHPRLGMVPPDRFIPLAEDLGLIGELDAWVLEQSCRQLAVWDRAGFQVPYLAANLSVRDIERPNLVDQIQSILNQTGIVPGRLELEVTESMLMLRTQQALTTLEALRGLGIRLAVDDFGTGYSSLAYLKRLPLHRLKIDRSFTSGLTQDPNDDSIARAIIALAHSLGMDVVAEGIETPDQAAFLCREGCRIGQGYLFGRPVSASELATRWTGATAGGAVG